jgi:aconitate hydratase 2 / 2-methylisocitrate dehydratase
VLLDEVRAGGRINLIIGRGLTDKAREALGLPVSTLFRLPQNPADTGKGFTLAQKMVGRACGVPEGKGMRPGTYCEPKMTTVGSQDTTGPMTRDELKDLACLGFSADLVMQSFCHTAAYPKPVDVKDPAHPARLHQTRGGVSLRPGDGVIHSWLNRMLLPDTVGTGGDSHTRFPIGISFPAGSGLVAFAAATGVMPLDMPESVLVRFKGKMQPGITLRDLVNAIPYVASAGPADRGEEGQEEHLLRPHPGNRRAAGPEGRAGLRTVRRLRRALRRRLHGRAEQGADHRVPALQHHPAEVDDRRRLRTMRTLEPRIKRHGRVAGQPAAAGSRCRRRIRRRDRDRPGEIKEPMSGLPNDPDDVKPAVRGGRRPRSTKCSSAPA